MAYDKQNPNKKTVMKKILSKLSVLALLALPVATSCELDQYSPTNPSPEEIVYTMPQAESWRLGLYTTLRSVYGFDISDLQTDNFVLTNQDGNQNGFEFNWTFNNNDNDRSTTVWANAYTTIFRANAVLENVPKVLTNATDLTAADTLEINQILGEAHLVRAMMYQRLATYFTDRYDRATASQQLGLPIVEVLDVDYLPARVSLDSTYNYIRHELSLARSLMNGSDPSRYLSGDVVNYLLPSAAIDIVEARVELTTGNYAEAAAIAERLIASGAYPLATTTEELNDMWLNDRGSEIIFEPYQSTEERGASWGNFTGLNASLTSQLGVNAYVPLIYPSNEAMSRYEATDIRFPATFFQGWSYAAYYATGNANSGWAIMLNKYPGNPSLKIAATDQYNMAKVFRIPEAYLIAAEAEYRQGHTGEALSYYNALHHDARGASELTTTDNFITDLCDEYVREYIGEGLVFSALKRLNQSVVRSAANQQVGTNTSIAAINITPDNIRWTWEIPLNDLTGNTNLVGNW